MDVNTNFMGTNLNVFTKIGAIIKNITKKSPLTVEFIGTEE